MIQGAMPTTQSRALKPFRRFRRRISHRRIFCIGFNKTGTMSLHQAFVALGYDSHHGKFWPHFSWDRRGKSYFNVADCFSDGEYANYANLDAWFPQALFILNHREERAWLRSRVKHFLAMVRKAEDRYGGRGLEAIRPHRFRHIEVTRGPELSIDRWIATRRLYHQHARSYFSNRQDFIELDVTSDKAWNKTLTTFLAANDERIEQERLSDPVHVNARDTDSEPDQEHLAELFELVDERLARYGPE